MFGMFASYECIWDAPTPPPSLPPWPPLTAAALIFADVNRAVNNLQLPNENESKAVDARQEIDLRIGASFTRLQTLLLQNKFDWGEYAPDGRIMIRCGAAAVLLCCCTACVLFPKGNAEQTRPC